MSRLHGDVNALQEFFETSVNAVGDLFLLILEWRPALLTLVIVLAIFGIRALWPPHARHNFASFDEL
ncbi:MAG: hypothetical protein QM676_13020 [Novosphingobium sp.]